jgi:hypothetical protein
MRQRRQRRKEGSGTELGYVGFSKTVAHQSKGRHAEPELADL